MGLIDLSAMNLTACTVTAGLVESLFTCTSPVSSMIIDCPESPLNAGSTKVSGMALFCSLTVRFRAPLLSGTYMSWTAGMEGFCVAVHTHTCVCARERERERN